MTPEHTHLDPAHKVSCVLQGVLHLRSPRRHRADGATQHTLADELTHVIQQRSGPVAGTDNGAGLKVSDPILRFRRGSRHS